MTSTSTLPVGVIGLGVIGSTLARGLARNGLGAVLHDVDPERATALPGRAATSAAEVGERCGIVLLAVIDEPQVRQVLFGPDGLLTAPRTDLVVVLTSTISGTAVATLDEECAVRGVRIVDCGVTMGEDAVERGPVCMVGGEPDVVERVMPVLRAVSKDVVHCGTVGAGMATKIARNLITYGTWTVVADAVRLAASAGISPETLLRAIDASDPDGRTTFRWLRMLLDGVSVDDQRAGATAGLLDKDIAAAQDLAGRQGLDLPLLEIVRRQGRSTLMPDRREDSTHG